MSKVSILIPSRNEVCKTNYGVTVLQQTVLDVLSKAKGDFEVIVYFDGPPYQELPQDNHLITLYNTEPKGSKICMNRMINLADGKYVMKLDSHCMVSEGFDEILQSNIEDNWIVTPRFYVLNSEEWKWQDERFYDYFFLPCPFTDKKQFRFQAGGHWKERTSQRLDIPIDENMKLHGSSFFLNKEFFLKNIKQLDYTYDVHSGEDIELSLKYWLGPWNGKLMVNKNAWYAHMHKGGQRPMGYHIDSKRVIRTYDYIAKYWMNNSWQERFHDLEWLIERFQPVPTWPENWKELWMNWKGQAHEWNSKIFSG